MSLFVANLRLADGSAADLLIEAGRIASIGPGLTPPAGAEVIEAEGRLLLPALVDGHVHLDKTLIGLPFIPHIPGDTVAKRIAAERKLRREINTPVEARGGALIERMATLGTVALRSHVDIDPEVGLAGLEAVLRLKQSHGHLMDIQTVAFPQSGILREPGTAALLDEAAKAGVDLIGGLDPAGIDGDVTGHLDIVFDVAARHGIGLDIHLHDGGSLGAHELQQIARRTEDLGLAGKVNVSHAFCLGELAPGLFAATAEALARAGVSIMTSAPGPVPMPPIKALRAAGVTVFAANDNIRDAWSPFGSGDLLERAALVCDRQDFRADDDLALALDLVSTVPAAILGREIADLTPGSPADLMLVAAGSRAEAVASRPRDRIVIKAGRVIARDGALI